MSTINGFRFTHRKRSNGSAVAVLEETKLEVTFAYEAEGQLYRLSRTDFNKRFMLV